jgi:hypothetical protein
VKALLKLAALGALVAAAAATGCKEDLKDRAEFKCPRRDIYVKYVSEVMEKRCGMLDCHGNDLRPMRIYGKFGLRHQLELNRTGEGESSDLERSSNYFGVCSVEPEKMSQVVDDPGGNSVNTLLMVRKGRGQEGHKGGKVFEPWDDSDRCVVGWLRGDAEQSVKSACAAALARLP